MQPSAPRSPTSPWARSQQPTPCGRRILSHMPSMATPSQCQPTLERASTTYSWARNDQPYLMRCPVRTLLRNLSQVVLQPLSLLLDELATQHPNVLHAVHPKRPEVLAQLAPGS